MGRLALVLVGSRQLNKRTCRFIESLQASGFDPVVLAVPRRSWDTAGMEVPALVARQGLVSARSEVRRPPWRTRPGLVVSLHWSTLPVAMLVKRLLRVPVIYDEHDDFELLALEGSGPAWANRFRSWWVRRVHASYLSRVDVVTCIRTAGGRLHQRLCARSTTVVELHNYPSHWWGERRRDRAPEGLVSIVYVGGIWAVKGCSAMLDAFLLLTGDEALPPLALHVFGRGDHEIERRLSTSHGVTFHGSSTAHDIAAFLAGHNCLGLVLLDATPRYSLVSTNCHKLYEYLACGVPVLATNVGEIPEIVEVLDGGWIIETGFDPETLAATLRDIVTRPKELRLRGSAAAAAIERDGLWWEEEWRKVEATGVLDLPLTPPPTPGTMR